MCRRKVNPSERDKKRNCEEAGKTVIKKMRAAVRRNTFTDDVIRIVFKFRVDRQ